LGTAELPPDGNEPWQVGDWVRNVLLFVPLGASLAWTGVRARRAVLACATLSALVELAQRAIPGRFASVSDWVCNVTGVGIGFAWFRFAPIWMRPSSSRARRLVLVAGAAASAVLLGTGVLLAPAPSAATFYVHRTPSSLAHLAPYGGTVLDARIDDIELPSGTIPDSDAVRARLGGDYALRVDVRAGPPPTTLAAFVLITDADLNEILLLGPDRDDLVYRFRSVGDAIGFQTALVRLPHALHQIRPGDPLSLTVQRSGDDLCFAIDGAFDCGHGFTVGDGWQLLAPDYRILAAWRVILSATWLAALFLPLGFWGRWDAASAATWAVAWTALLLAPAITALRATPVSEVTGAGFGAALGIAVRRHVETRFGPQRGTR